MNIFFIKIIFTGPQHTTLHVQQEGNLKTVFVDSKGKHHWGRIAVNELTMGIEFNPPTTPRGRLPLVNSIGQFVRDGDSVRIPVEAGAITRIDNHLFLAEEVSYGESFKNAQEAYVEKRIIGYMGECEGKKTDRIMVLWTPPANDYRQQIVPFAGAYVVENGWLEEHCDTSAVVLAILHPGEGLLARRFSRIDCDKFDATQLVYEGNQVIQVGETNEVNTCLMDLKTYHVVGNLPMSGMLPCDENGLIVGIERMVSSQTAVFKPVKSETSRTTTTIPLVGKISEGGYLLGTVGILLVFRNGKTKVNIIPNIKSKKPVDRVLVLWSPIVENREAEVFAEVGGHSLGVGYGKGILEILAVLHPRQCVRATYYQHNNMRVLVTLRYEGAGTFDCSARYFAPGEEHGDYLA